MKNYEERTLSIKKKVENLEKKKKRQRRVLYSCAGLTLCLALAVVPFINEKYTTPDPVDNVLGGVSFATDYAQVYEAINANLEKNEFNSRAGGNAVADTAASPEPSSKGASMSSPTQDESTSSKEYSATNTQVEGIDEGDIVKTDGEYIYSLSAYEVRILKADGENSELISTFEVAENPDSQGKTGTVQESVYPFELYVDGDTLAVILNKHSPFMYNYKYAGATEDMLIGDWGKASITVDFYDISNPAEPVKKGSVGQDGYNVSSRMIDGSIYLVSSYSVYSADDVNKPEEYVPCFYKNGEGSPIDVSSISILPENDETAYTVVGVYDMKKGNISSTQSVLGGGDKVYMNDDNLYVSNTKYETEESEARTEDVYEIVDVHTYSSTQILRFSLSAGSVSLAAEGSVQGYLENQFSMDEQDGYLRLVVTNNEETYRTYEDKSRGWTNYEMGETTSDNNLYVLDSALNKVGSIENLAEGEIIYSARFDGNIGYFVTFKQTDPLFSVDLSDPTAPKLLGQLKIPGFSEYLHSYEEGRLFGIGMNADEETGLTEDIKLSMFDVTDPANVTEKKALSLGGAWSEALYNHKAILVSSARDIIGFPMDDKYVIYGYNDNSGFYKRAELTLGELDYNARGLYIDNYAYIVSTGSVTVMDMSALKIVKTVELEEN